MGGVGEIYAFDFYPRVPRKKKMHGFEFPLFTPNNVLLHYKLFIRFAAGSPTEEMQA